MSFEARAADLLGSAIIRSLPLGGGCIADVSRLVLADGRRVVAKRGAPGLALEGWMLGYLADTGGLTVPKVYHASDELLLIEYLAEEGVLGPAAEQDAARQIAALHSVTAEAFGFERETVIAGLTSLAPGACCPWRALPTIVAIWRRRRYRTSNSCCRGWRGCWRRGRLRCFTVISGVEIFW